MSLRKIVPKNKSGGIGDVLFFVITIFSLALFFLIVNYVIPEVTDKLRDTEINDTSGARTALDAADSAVGNLDTIFLTIFVILLAGVLISSFMIEAHPIFIPIYIIVLVMTIIIGVLLNNVHDEFLLNPTLSESGAEQTFANAIINNYVLVIAVVGFLSMILIFGKPRLGGGRERL